MLVQHRQYIIGDVGAAVEHPGCGEDYFKAALLSRFCDGLLNCPAVICLQFAELALVALEQLAIYFILKALALLIKLGLELIQPCGCATYSFMTRSISTTPDVPLFFPCTAFRETRQDRQHHNGANKIMPFTTKHTSFVHLAVCGKAAPQLYQPGGQPNKCKPGALGAAWQSRPYAVRMSGQRRSRTGQCAYSLHPYQSRSQGEGGQGVYQA